MLTSRGLGRYYWGVGGVARDRGRAVQYLDQVSQLHTAKSNAQRPRTQAHKGQYCVCGSVLREGAECADQRKPVLKWGSAARQGHVEAQYNLGVMRAYGYSPVPLPAILLRPRPLPPTPSPHYPPTRSPRYPPTRSSRVSGTDPARAPGAYTECVLYWSEHVRSVPGTDAARTVRAGTG
eukprot:854321-Rhodomonas_salina.2